MNTYIQVFKNKSRYSRLFLVLCLLFILLGVIGLVVSFATRKQFMPLLNDGAFFSLTFSSSISFWFVWDSMKKAKYFVAWNDIEISYLLPKSGETEVIVIESIKTVDIHRGEIIIGLNNGETKHFNLNYFFFPERKTIVDFFEGLKQ